MLEIRTINKEDVGRVSNFISRININEESHIGYCGTDKDEIANSMINDISDVKYFDSFVAAYEDNNLVGVLGFDAELEDSSAEIWGPFIVPNKWDIVFDMWKKMTELLPDEINSMEMFPNGKNIRVCELAKKLSFKKYSEETILIFQRNNCPELESVSIDELTPEYCLDMQQLHDEAFPDTYYSAQQITKRLDENKKVFIITKEGIFCGYIYVEAEPEFREGNIEFFAVEKSERGNGIGGQLLTGALKWLITIKDIESIRLCVNSSNGSAVNLYKKVGFQHLHDLSVFTKNLRK
ncbi:GNAT family N-acetyltransferase [Alteribacillus sp. HJP-4]|uniref:GNAT family N-acetyltransferase n=1 Tax=Alteribacillus sp. HJP-4 TaxID=2775394 RepID=UPI0035CD06DE